MRWIETVVTNLLRAPFQLRVSATRTVPFDSTAAPTIRDQGTLRALVAQHGTPPAFVYQGIPVVMAVRDDAVVLAPLPVGPIRAVIAGDGRTFVVRDQIGAVQARCTDTETAAHEAKKYVHRAVHRAARPEV
jgi:hypothetical protein